MWPSTRKCGALCVWNVWRWFAAAQSWKWSPPRVLRFSWVVTLIWFVRRAVQGLYTLGDLALLYQAYVNGKTLLGTLHGSIGAVYRNMLYLSNLFEYLDMESTLTRG